MKVCIITHSRKVGKTTVDNIFWDVASSEAVARKLVMLKAYNEGVDESVLDEDGWYFREQDVVFGERDMGGHGR